MENGSVVGEMWAKQQQNVKIGHGNWLLACWCIWFPVAYLLHTWFRRRCHRSTRSEMEAAGKGCGNEWMNLHLHSFSSRQFIHSFIPDFFLPIHLWIVPHLLSLLCENRRGSSLFAILSHQGELNAIWFHFQPPLQRHQWTVSHFWLFFFYTSVTLDGNSF